MIYPRPVFLKGDGKLVHDYWFKAESEEHEKNVRKKHEDSIQEAKKEWETLARRGKP